MTDPFIVAIDHTRRQIIASQKTKERIQLLWAGAKTARHLAGSDEVVTRFIQLAIETGLIDVHGCWIGKDVRESVRRLGKEDVQRVLEWALRDTNPFEKGKFR